MDMILSIVVSVICIGIVFIMVHLWYKKKTKKLVEELTLFKKEKEYFSEVMLIFSDRYDIVFANQAAKVLFSLDDNYHIPSTVSEIQLKIDRSEAENFFDILHREIQKNNHSFHLKNVLLIILGKMRQVNIYVDKSAWNLNKTISCVIDMDAMNTTAVTTTQVDGSIDTFTNLPNQFTALTQINTLVMKNKNASTSFALFLVGIDHFHELQTTLGVTFSNKIIKNISEYLKKYETELRVYRMDCDKFLLLVENTKEDEFIYDMAKKIIVDMKNNEGTNEHLTTSIGISKYPQDGENASKLINRVYVALDQAQEESEANITFYANEFKAMHKDEHRINEEIQLGLKNHDFFLYYQPMFDLKTEEMIGAEALLRWKHPELGIITAEKFLDVAKKTGLIVEIGEYVFREVIKQRKVWNDTGLQKFKISLNLSLKEMQVETLIQRLETLFKDYDINPQDFNLDITEKSAMNNFEKTVEDFKQFRHLGLSISLDNFGLDSSSIKHLQILPLNMVKIDRSLIFDLYSNLDHQITVKAMITLIHNLGFKVVAEGVESSKESELLYEYGCDYAQGYLFAKPLPAKELEALLR